jgi:hypothetical protein
MSTEMDFKALWNKQDAGDIPDTKELFAKADNLKRNTRNKLIGLNLMLLATAALVIYIGLNVDHEQVTTKIGIVLIAVAIISYLVAYNQMIPLLFKPSLQSNSHEYLTQLISIKRKHEFLNKVMINIYFILLSSGLALYMMQFAFRMSTFWGIFWYVITFSWIALAWFYLRPRGVKKKLKPLNEIIARLEEVNGQLREEE